MDNKNVVVRFRVTQIEKEFILKAAQKCGMNLSMYLRKLALVE